MYGAFIGDIVGSKYEFNNIKTKDFPLFSSGCDFTDDTIMTVAVAKAILLTQSEKYINKPFYGLLIECMQQLGRKYPYPTGAYGANFSYWLRENDPKPYGSYGNGSAMRVSPCGLAAVTLKEAQDLAYISASVSHNHPEGIRGAVCVASAVFMAKTGKSKDEIKKYVTDNYYDLDFTLDGIRDTYSFDGSCQGSVPQAVVAFLESNSFEDAVRNVISIGGDCDTTGAITGSVAWAYYSASGADASMQKIKDQALHYLPKEFVSVAEEFREFCQNRADTFYKTGNVKPISDEKKRQ